MQGPDGWWWWVGGDVSTYFSVQLVKLNDILGTPVQRDDMKIPKKLLEEATTSTPEMVSNTSENG